MSAPTSYRPAFADIARDLAAHGARDKDVAAAFGVHPKTVQAWKHRHGDLAAALGEGRARRPEGAGRVPLFAQALGRDRPSERIVVEGDALLRRPAVDHVPPSDRAIIAWLTGRRPDRWRRPPRAAAFAAGARRDARLRPSAPGRKPPAAAPIAPGLSRYDPAFDAVAEQLARAGALDRDLAFVFAVHRGTIGQWRKRHPSFAAALARGKAAADDRVEQALFRRATGYDWCAPADPGPIDMVDGRPAPAPSLRVRHVRPSEPAAIFWLANRRPDRWRPENASSAVAPPAPPSRRTDDRLPGLDGGGADRSLRRDSRTVRRRARFDRFPDRPAAHITIMGQFDDRFGSISLPSRPVGQIGG